MVNETRKNIEKSLENDTCYQYKIMVLNVKSGETTIQATYYQVTASGIFFVLPVIAFMFNRPYIAELKNRVIATLGLFLTQCAILSRDR